MVQISRPANRGIPPVVERDNHIPVIAALASKLTHGVNQIDIHKIYCPINYIRIFTIDSDSGMNSIRCIF